VNIIVSTASFFSVLIVKSSNISRKFQSHLGVNTMSPDDLAARALARSAAYRQDADAKSTVKAYKSDFAHFKGWCQKNGFEAKRPTPEIVAAYLAGCGEGYTLSTLRRRVAAIRYFSDTRNYKLDTRAGIIRETLKGIARNHGEPSRRAAALTIDEVRRLCEVCDDTLVGQRDRALFLVGFAGALRRSELVRLDVEDIELTSMGMILLLTRSKTDKEGRGVEIAISNGTHDTTCPVRALKRWIKAGGIRSGPLFRKIHSSGCVLKRHMTPDAVRQILLKRAAMAGLKGRRRRPISPHGLRAGFITTAYRNGVRDEEIMEHTRHRSYETMRSYIRREKLSDKSPAGKLGL
jgi:integrase